MSVPVLTWPIGNVCTLQGFAGEVNLACDPAMLPAATPTWPLDFREGLSIASLVPATVSPHPT